MAKPPLNLVDANATSPSPPRKLGQHGLELWRQVMTEYSIADRGGIELLCQACGALDRVEALAERISADGEVILVRGVPKPHPALQAELAARSLVCWCLERLGLNLEAIKPIGRPPGPGFRGVD
jgi:hypothetical protein